MKTIELKQHPEVQSAIRAAFPSYKKRSAFISVFSEHGVNVNTFWDGGSRDEYAIVELATGKRHALPTRTHPFFDIASRGVSGETEALSVDARGNITLKLLPDGFALVQGGIFCGKTATAHIYLNASNIAKYLEAGQ
jgi:hypothetical protein